MDDKIKIDTLCMRTLFYRVRKGKNGCAGAGRHRGDDGALGFGAAYLCTHTRV